MTRTPDAATAVAGQPRLRCQLYRGPGSAMEPATGSLTRSLSPSGPAAAHLSPTWHLGTAGGTVTVTETVGNLMSDSDSANLAQGFQAQPGRLRARRSAAKSCPQFEYLARISLTVMAFRVRAGLASRAGKGTVTITMVNTDETVASTDSELACPARKAVTLTSRVPGSLSTVTIVTGTEKLSQLPRGTATRIMILQH